MSKDHSSPAFSAILEMECPQCKKAQYIKIANNRDSATQCCACKAYLFVFPFFKSRPNLFQIVLKVRALPPELDIQKTREKIERDFALQAIEATTESDGEFLADFLARQAG